MNSTKTAVIISIITLVVVVALVWVNKDKFKSSTETAVVA